MAVQIRIDQMGKPPGVAGKAREDLDLGTPVTVTALGGHFNQYQWSFGGKPVNVIGGSRSAAVFSAPQASASNISPIDTTGTYLIRLAVDSGNGLGANPEDNASITFYAGQALSSDPRFLPRRQPAVGETTEHNVADTIDPGGNTDGWARERARWDEVLTYLYNQVSASGLIRTLSATLVGDFSESTNTYQPILSLAVNGVGAGHKLIVMASGTGKVVGSTNPATLAVDVTNGGPLIQSAFVDSTGNAEYRHFNITQEFSQAAGNCTVTLKGKSPFGGGQLLIRPVTDTSYARAALVVMEVAS